MFKTWKALSLFSSMISGGENHSDVSRQALDDALDEIDSIQRLVDAAQKWRLNRFNNHNLIELSNAVDALKETK